jgi:RNA polymerase sigma factor (sigma-70 family)
VRKSPPPDPRLLELLPWIQRRAAQLVARKRWPLTRDEAKSIAGAFLFTYLLSHPGPANDVAGLAWYRVRGAIQDELRTRSGRRHRPTQYGTRWGFDPHEVQAAMATGQLPQIAFEALDSYGDFELVGVDPVPNVEALAIEHEEAHAVRQLLADAPGCNDRERFIVNAYLLEGRTQDNIAQELGVSESRVNQLLHRAVKKLRMHYEGRPVAARRRGRRRSPRPKP